MAGGLQLVSNPRKQLWRRPPAMPFYGLGTAKRPPAKTSESCRWPLVVYLGCRLAAVMLVPGLAHVPARFGAFQARNLVPVFGDPIRGLHAIGNVVFKHWPLDE